MEESNQPPSAAEPESAHAQASVSASPPAAQPVATKTATETAKQEAVGAKEPLWRRTIDSLDRQSKAADAANKIVGIIAIVFGGIWVVVNVFLLHQVDATRLGIKKINLETEKISLDISKTKTDVDFVKQSMLQSETFTRSISHDLRPKIHIELKADVLDRSIKNNKFEGVITVEVKIKNSGKEDLPIDLLAAECFISSVEKIADREKLFDHAPNAAPEELILDSATPVGLTFYPGRVMSTHFVFGGETDSLTGIQKVQSPGLYMVSFVLINKEISIWTGGQKMPLQKKTSENVSIITSARTFIYVN